MYIIKENTDKMNRPIIIAVDFDDTICANGFPDISKGTLIKGAKETINKLYDEGYFIIIWTCRYLNNHIQDCKNFLKENEIKYNEFNENFPGLEFKPTPKIYYDYLLDDKCLIDIDWNWIYPFIKIKFAKSDLYEITNQMKQHFYNRTKRHIELTKKYYEKYFISNDSDINIEYSDILYTHDKNKFDDICLAPYISITWQYYCKDNKIDFYVSQELKDAMNKATEYHVRTNEHHPEFWSNRTDSLIPKNDRDKFDPNSVPTIDVSKTMEINYIVEMCADWCAMSEERGNTPFEWADKVIGKRWYFGKEKTNLIYKVLNIMWK